MVKNSHCFCRGPELHCQQNPASPASEILKPSAFLCGLPYSWTQTHSRTHIYKHKIKNKVNFKNYKTWIHVTAFISASALKRHEQGNLLSKLFLWVYGCRGLRVHHDPVTQQQAAGMRAGTESEELTSRSVAKMRLEAGQDNKYSAPTSSDLSPPSRTHHLKSRQTVPP